MAQRMGGMRRKTRRTLKKHYKEKGKLSLTRYLQNFNTGDKVIMNAEPSVHEGQYHTRFHGKYGIVQKNRGKCYEVEIDDHGKKKMLIVHPAHLKRLAI